MESSYCQQAVTFFFAVFDLLLAWPPHSLACSTAPETNYQADLNKRVKKATKRVQKTLLKSLFQKEFGLCLSGKKYTCKERT